MTYRLCIRFYFFCIIASLLLSCSSKSKEVPLSKETVNIPLKADPTKFEKYLAHFKFYNTPLILNCGLPSYKYEDAPFFNSSKFGFKTPMVIAGTIYPQNNFHTLLCGIVGDDLYPFLITFNKEGIKIDSLDLSGNCNREQGYSGHSKVIFNVDYSITKTDSVITYHVNSDSERIPGTDSTVVITFRYKLNYDGRFARIDSIKRIIHKK